MSTGQNCFDNYIGVRGDCDETRSPSSALYIDDLPGITLARAAKIADAGQTTGVKVAKAAISRAIKKTQRVLVNEMLDVVTFNAIPFSKRASKFVSDSYGSATTQDSGMELELCSNCRLVEMYIPEVRVNLKEAGSHTLKIVEGSKTTTYEFTALAERAVCVITNYSPTTSIIQILIESGVKPNNSTLNSGCFNCPDIICDCSQDSGVKIKGVGDSVGLTYGVQPLVNLECSEDKFFCEIKHIASAAVWYNAGVEFMSEAIATDRLNDFSEYGLEEAREQRDRWESDADVEIKRIVKKLPNYLTSIDSCCIQCNSTHWTNSLP